MKKIKVIVKYSKESYEKELVEFMNNGFEIKFANISTSANDRAGRQNTYFAILEKEE